MSSAHRLFATLPASSDLSYPHCFLLLCCKSEHCSYAARGNNAGAHPHAWLQRSSVGTVSNEQRGFRSEMGVAAPGKFSEQHIVSCSGAAFMAHIAYPGCQNAICIMSIALGGRISTTDDGWRTGDIGHAANRGRCYHVGGRSLGLQA